MSSDLLTFHRPQPRDPLTASSYDRFTHCTQDLIWLLIKEEDQEKRELILDTIVSNFSEEQEISDLGLSMVVALEDRRLKFQDCWDVLTWFTADKEAYQMEHYFTNDWWKDHDQLRELLSRILTEAVKISRERTSQELEMDREGGLEGKPERELRTRLEKTIENMENETWLCDVRYRTNLYNQRFRDSLQNRTFVIAAPSGQNYAGVRELVQKTKAAYLAADSDSRTEIAQAITRYLETEISAARLFPDVYPDTSTIEKYVNVRDCILNLATKQPLPWAKGDPAINGHLEAAFADCLGGEASADDCGWMFHADNDGPGFCTAYRGLIQTVRAELAKRRATRLREGASGRM